LIRILAVVNTGFPTRRDLSTERKSWFAERLGVGSANAWAESAFAVRPESASSEITLWALQWNSAPHGL